MPIPESPLKWQAFHLSKAGNAAADYEDAFAADPASGRFAVADGASEASFAALWARLLTEGFINASGKPWRDLDWLAPLRQRWVREVGAMPLPWYAEAKRDAGAFATFLGLVFRPAWKEQAPFWRALAVGDSCLFRTRLDRLLKAFPVTHSDAFGNQPRLLRSRASGVEPECEQTSGRWRSGDRFLLTTDALAQWFLRRIEEGEKPCAEVAHLLAESDPQAAFPGWVEERRKSGILRNDDVTLLVIDL
jgi:hypothetical protein